MKKTAVFITVLFCVVFCAVPCFAEIDIPWPPPTYDMPRTVFTLDMLEALPKSLKLSIGAISRITDLWCFSFCFLDFGNFHSAFLGQAEPL